MVAACAPSQVARGRGACGCIDRLGTLASRMYCMETEKGRISLRVSCTAALHLNLLEEGEVYPVQLTPQERTGQESEEKGMPNLFSNE